MTATLRSAPLRVVLRPAFLRVLAAVAGLVAGAAGADTNGVINYQGRVVVGSTLFNGTGRFKFALLSADGTQTYWRNAPSSAPSGEPDQAVIAQVASGLYNVGLGDVSVTNMAALPFSVFTGAVAQTSSNPLFLRVWFNDGTHGSEALTPDQRVTPVSFSLASSYAQKAGGVAAGFRLRVEVGAVNYLPLEMQGNLANLGASSSNDGLTDAWKLAVIQQVGLNLTPAQIHPGDMAPGDRTHLS